MNLFEGMGETNRSHENKALISKWSRTGLLEGLGDKQEEATVSVMLENQAKQLLKEGSATTAGTAGSGYEQWTGVALPLIRRVYAEIAAKEFVSVQPMNLPSGLVFYLDFKYANDKNPFGFDPEGKNQTGTLQGVTDTTGDPSDGLYGAGRFGYSVNTLVAAAGDITTGSVSQADVFYDGNYTASIAEYASVAIPLTMLTSSNGTGYDAEGVRSFQLVSASAELDVIEAFTQVVGSNLQFIVTGSAITGEVVDANISFSLQPTNDDRGDFEAKPVSATNRDLDTDLNIPSIELQMRSIPVTAKTRKLKASWTPEFAQDLNAYHSVDAEGELTSMLSEYVSMEIDLEILDMLISSAATSDFWSAKVGQEFNSATNAFEASQFNGQAYIQGTWFSTLGTKVQKVSNDIHAKTLRGGANFLVCSPRISTILESIPGYAAADGTGKSKYAMGVRQVGAINNAYDVYKNPYMQENTILMGFRGSQFLETGAVYAPYVPLMLTPLVYDPKNFTPRRGVMTRYAKLVTRPEFYGKINVADLNVL
jgi:hypothetical protein